MKKTTTILAGLMIAFNIFAATVVENVVLKGDVVFDSGANWKIGSTKVTSSASDLNNIAGGTMSAANLTAGTTASAINGTSITNLNASKIAAGTTISAINGTSITNLSAANLSAGTTASAIAGGSITNLNGANIASGNIPIASLTNASLTVGPYIGGNIPQAAMTNALLTIGPYIGGNLSSSTITNALTNITSTVRFKILYVDDNATFSGTTVTITNNLVVNGTLSGNLNATNITQGNLTQSVITNALLTAGPKIGGNIPFASITNAVPGLITGATRTYTNMSWDAGATTGNVVFINGILQ